MSQNENQNDDLEIQNVEIEPLSDEALEDVAGGLTRSDEFADSCGTCCSCSQCSN
ncbi:MAG TPA: hypothetical protein VGC13_01450 [Longimicrobium sp.]|jgi:hypothetical protein|uniref:hypothetical protein n=1 Tax=Longimicrobium sp. TaxID=2029185 RepID=UPI002ED8519B